MSAYSFIHSIGQLTDIVRKSRRLIRQLQQVLLGHLSYRGFHDAGCRCCFVGWSVEIVHTRLLADGLRRAGDRARHFRRDLVEFQVRLNAWNALARIQ